jgi:hypothetical protein
MYMLTMKNSLEIEYFRIYQAQCYTPLSTYKLRINHVYMVTLSQNTIASSTLLNY